MTDDVGSIQGPIANGGSTDDTTPTLSGGGQQPGDTITIIDNGSPIGTVPVNPDGTWESVHANKSALCAKSDKPEVRIPFGSVSLPPRPRCNA